MGKWAMATVFSILVAWLATGATSPASGAQDRNKNKDKIQMVQQRDRKANPLYKLDAAQFARQDHAQAVGLPNLPEYTGRIISTKCSTMPHLRTGQMIWITYNVKEEWPLVSNWYSDSFRNYRWTLDKGLQADDCIAAVDGQYNTCQVLCNRTSKQGCEFTIQYKCASR